MAVLSVQKDARGRDQIALDLTTGIEGCAYGGAPLEPCPKCGRLGQPKRAPRSTTWLHQGVFKLDRSGEAKAFAPTRRCTKRDPKEAGE